MELLRTRISQNLEACMKLKSIIIFTFLISTSLVASKWEIDASGGSVLLSSPGNIMHGDSYRIILDAKSKESCNIARQYISNYAVVDNAKEKYRNLPSKYVLTKTKKGDEQINFLMTIEYTSNFLLGKSTIFGVSANRVQDLIDFHKDNDKIYLELLAFYDYENNKKIRTEITEYYDIPKNTWDLDGFEEALQKAQMECLNLIKQS